MATIFDQVRQLPQDHLNVFYTIQRKGPVQKEVIIEATGLKLSKLNRILRTLEEMRLIVLVGEGDSTGGRKPFLFDVDRDAYYIFGLSMGTLRFTLTLVNLKMEVLACVKGTNPRGMLPIDFLNKISGYIKSIMEERKISCEQIVGLGIGHFSKVNAETGQLLRACSFFVHDDWTGFYTLDEFQRKTGFHTFVDSNVDCIGLAITRYGEAVGVHKAVVLACATSIRSSVIIDGVPIYQDRMADDAFGHMTIDMDGPLCRCGNYGCVDCYASLASMRERFLSALKLGRTTMIRNIPETGPTIEQLEEACRNGDPLAHEVLHHGAVALGVGIANYINLFDPDVVVITSLLAEKSPTYCNKARDTAFSRLSRFNRSSDIKIIRAVDESLSFDLGSCIYFFERWIFPKKFQHLLPKY